MTARHDINSHPASSGQLSVITILNRHRQVRTAAAKAVREALVVRRPSGDTTRLRAVMPPPVPR